MGSKAKVLEKRRKNLLNVQEAPQTFKVSELKLNIGVESGSVQHASCQDLCKD
jgi:hypothetical protein